MTPCKRETKGNLQRTQEQSNRPYGLWNKQNRRKEDAGKGGAKMADKIRVARAKLNAALARQNALRMVRAGGHGHIGGAFSAIDIVTALYFDKMNIDPKDPHKEDRDRFLLSAGHKAMCQYAVLAERGYFDKSILDTYGSLHSRIPGHPNMQELPGVEANTGALGHGLSIANGMAMAAKLSGKNFKVYAITGDGRLQLGSSRRSCEIRSGQSHSFCRLQRTADQRPRRGRHEHDSCG